MSDIERKPESETERMERALDLYRRPFAVTDRDFSERIAALLPFLPRPRKLVAMRSWVAAGLMMLASMALIPLMADFAAFRAYFGAGYELPLAIVCAFCAVAYCSLFVASHLDELRRLLDGRDRDQRRRAAQ